jgi:predicted nucleotidyltransferase
MTQLQNITSKILEKRIHKKLLSYGIVHFSIFGSYARSEAHKESDLDVVLDLLPKNNITL